MQVVAGSISPEFSNKTDSLKRERKRLDGVGHFPSETSMKRSATVRLLFFVLVILLVSVALNHTLPSKTPFNRQPLDRLRADRPGIVLIGDSLVHAAIDPQLLQKELGDGKVEMIWRGGAASAAW